MPDNRRFLTIFLVAVIFSSCSTQRNTLITRTYHQVTARYNTFFNGRESFRQGVKRVEQQYQFDYNQILPVFLFPDPDLARSVVPQMDRAISKSSKIIANKSITSRPARRNRLFSADDEFYRQNEYNRWVRESYLLAGKAHFYKADFLPATQTFLYIIREYSMNSIRHEGRIWLARTYCRRGRYHEARMIIDEILADPDFPTDLNARLFATIADFHLLQNQPERAVVYLERALEATSDRGERRRYTYILAQLYERTGRPAEASEFYQRVTGMNAPYELEFNARISQARVAQSGPGGQNRMINDLGRMLRDEKNRDYHDQIYYALGSIYQSNNDYENAIDYFMLSARTRGSNSSQKALTYLALADIYFSYPDYIHAQAYYDSAVMIMSQDFPDYRAIVQKSSILNELADNIRLYQLEDSLQVLASLTEADRNKRIDEVIALARKEEADARRREQPAQQTGYSPARTSQAARLQAQRMGDGNWYFYNQSAVTFGSSEFESLWGDRRLEDNWRRSNRQVISPESIFMADYEATGQEETNEEIADAGSREHYLRNIPLSPEQMQASHQRLKESLYNIGELFRDDLKDFERSASAYRELIKRYPRANLAASAWYGLYSVHILSGNNQEAERCRELIISDYPGSRYATILTNPDFVREYENRMQEAELYYEKSFELFRERKFQQVRERTGYARQAWPESPLIPLFEYLEILCYGSEGNITLFREMLNDYADRYPGTERADNALEFIAYLDGDYPELMQQAQIITPQDRYRSNQEGEHHFVIIIDNHQDLINRMLFNIINFNVDHFARLDLNVNGEQFSTNYHLLKVDGLPDVPAALDYLARFSASSQVFSEAGRDDFPLFIVSPDNFGLFMQDKNIASYLNFFEDEYNRAP